MSSVPGGIDCGVDFVEVCHAGPACVGVAAPVVDLDVPRCDGLSLSHECPEPVGPCQPDEHLLYDVVDYEEVVYEVAWQIGPCPLCWFQGACVHVVINGQLVAAVVDGEMHEVGVCGEYGNAG